MVEHINEIYSYRRKKIAMGEFGTQMVPIENYASKCSFKYEEKTVESPFQ